jgi:integrase
MGAVTPPKFPNMEGPRFTSEGEARYRPYIKERGAKVRGPWGTAADGKAWLARATLTRLDGGSVAPQRTQTVQETSVAFLAGIEAGTILSRKEERYAASTVRAYQQAFRDWINPELGHIPVSGLRRDQVQRWVDWLYSQRAGGTTRNTWSALAAMYAWLLPRYHELNDPTIGVRLPRPGKPRERYADVDEMRDLLAPLPLERAVPFALAFYAGLRRAEIQALPIDMIDLEDGWLRVQYALDPQQGWKGPKSGAGERDVPIFANLRPYLEAQLERTGQAVQLSTAERPGSLLLPSRRRSRWGAQMFGRPFTRACADYWTDAGLHPIGLHEARHSFATALIRAGYDPRTVQEWIGHSDPTTTLKIYTKRRGRQTGLTEKMDAYLGA